MNDSSPGQNQKAEIKGHFNKLVFKKTKYQFISLIQLV